MTVVSGRGLATGHLPRPNVFEPGTHAMFGKAVPFVNPHLAGLDAARSDLLRGQHERLFAQTKVVLFNTAIGSIDGAATRLLELCR